jgi:AcrR family transcriptional regulator
MPATQPCSDPSRYQSTRNQALRLFAERGFSRVSMRELAD